MSLRTDADWGMAGGLLFIMITSTIVASTIPPTDSDIKSYTGKLKKENEAIANCIDQNYKSQFKDGPSMVTYYKDVIQECKNTTNQPL